MCITLTRLIYKNNINWAIEKFLALLSVFGDTKSKDLQVKKKKNEELEAKT